MPNGGSWDQNNAVYLSMEQDATLSPTPTTTQYHILISFLNFTWEDVSELRRFIIETQKHGLLCESRPWMRGGDGDLSVFLRPRGMWVCWGGGGYSHFFSLRRLGPSIYCLTPPHPEKIEKNIRSIRYNPQNNWNSNSRKIFQFCVLT